MILDLIIPQAFDSINILNTIIPSFKGQNLSQNTTILSHNLVTQIRWQVFWAGKHSNKSSQGHAIKIDNLRIAKHIPIPQFT